MSKVEVNQISSQCGSTLTIGQSGDTVTLACGATQTGFGRTGTVDWDTTAKTASFTAVSGNGYFVNTTSGAVTVTLPAGSAGDIVSLADYAATWQTNNLTVSPNGSDKIGGVNASVTLNTEGQSVTFVYTDSTQGWINTMDSTSNVRASEFILATGGTVTTCGDFKIHTFTSPGTFCVSAISGTAPRNVVDYLVVAGGGGAGATPSNAGGGGGGGGMRFYANTTCNPQPACNPASPRNNFPSGTSVSITATSFPITVGGGGAGGVSAATPNPVAVGTTGSNSIFSTITSAGGGGGGHGAPSCDPNINGLNGGSGGGGAGGNNTSTGGTGNTPPVSPSQGTNGAGKAIPTSPDHSASGGGGFMVAGSPAPSGSVSGDGGAGGGLTGFGSGNGQCSSCVQYFAGGGGGGRNPATQPLNASGGIGGGGGPQGSAGDTGGAGTANTGGGGGGGKGPNGDGGAGGSGIVVIRYKYQ
jgi:hypothetical protein